MTSERKSRMEAVLRHRQPDLTVVLENVQDPHNISAVLRTADSIGVSEVFVLKTELPRRPKFGKRSSAGVIKWMKVHEFQDPDACFHAVRQRYSQVLATHLSTGAKSLYELNLTLPTALVFGNELNGISDEVLAFCDSNFLIPQVGMVKSLNVSVACAVSLYEAFRQRGAAGFYNGRSRLSAVQEEHLKMEWGI